ncbi:MAG: hypothetical protein ACJAYU_000925 [Bradymonadia bacterium]|jgi:hypothetical protein
MRLAALFFAALWLTACGASSDYYYVEPDQSDYETDGSFDNESVAYRPIALSVESMGGSGSNSSRRSSNDNFTAPMAPQPTPTPTADQVLAGLPRQDTAIASADDVPPLDQASERSLPLLIYTGAITLAIYDVDEIQVSAVALAESYGGYSSQRTANSVTLRIPAERFRDALDALGDLGDTLSLSWDARDVTDQFNDVEVRLANARAMWERLEILLTQAENVSDALAIERELQRITLEIEMFEGQRREMVDRIAFSTIVVSFSRLPISLVPGDEYRLPFQWLNQLGVERLLSL